MSVIIGSARIDERGRARGGRAGDQTGRELSSQRWYAYGGSHWDWCARIKDKDKRKKFIDAMSYFMSCKYVGYDQNQRLTLYRNVKKLGFKNYRKLRTPCETDCSALVTCCLIIAGFTKLNPANTTATLRADMKKKYPNSFTWFTDAYKHGDHTRTAKWLRNGDILDREGHHVVAVLSGGRSVKPRTHKANKKYYNKYIGKSDSIVTALNALGANSSMTHRKAIAKANGIAGYSGTATQNTMLVKLARKGKLKRA